MPRKTPPKKKTTKKAVKKPIAKRAVKRAPRKKRSQASAPAVKTETPSAPPAGEEREVRGLRLSPTQLTAIQAMAAAGMSHADIAYSLHLPVEDLPEDLPALRNGRISNVLTCELEEILGLRIGERYRPDLEGMPTKRRFLVAYQTCGSITEASAAAGIDRSNHYDWLKDDPEYETAFTEADERFLDWAEGEAWRKALKGVVNPKFHQGILVGFEVLRSDGMHQFMLKARRPEKFRERGSVELTGKDGQPIETAITVRFVKPETPTS